MSMKDCFKTCEWNQASYRSGFERGYQAAKVVLETLNGIEHRSLGNFNTLVEEAMRTLKVMANEKDRSQ